MHDDGRHTLRHHSLHTMPAGCALLLTLMESPRRRVFQSDVHELEPGPLLGRAVGAVQAVLLADAVVIPAQRHVRSTHEVQEP